MNKEVLFEILLDWNFWERDFPKSFKRNRYEEKIEKISKAKEVTIIKGIRRSGKSTILINHIKNLVKNKKIEKNQVLLINFEDSRFSNLYSTELIDKLVEIYKEEINPKKRPIIILDEIQLIPMWERWVRTNYELDKADIFITGSSSKLLSREFGTSIGGRSIEIEMYPLSFEEYLTFKSKEIPKTKQELIKQKFILKKEFSNYIKIGGFPKITQLDEYNRKLEIQNYFDTIILKDIVARYNLKNADNVKKVAKFILSTITSPHSINSIRKATNISYDLVDNYLEYLCETYLLFKVPKFSTSLKKQFKEELKFYSIDTSFLRYIAFSIVETKSVEYENIVAIELKRRGYEVYYHKENKECDFITLKEKEINAIQVSYDISDENTKKREIEGLVEACNLYKLKKGIIINRDLEEEIIEEGVQIKIIPIHKWFLLK